MEKSDPPEKGKRHLMATIDVQAHSPFRLADTPRSLSILPVFGCGLDNKLQAAARLVLGVAEWACAKTVVLEASPMRVMAGLDAAGSAASDPVIPWPGP